MITSKSIINILIFITLCSCNNASTNSKEIAQIDNLGLKMNSISKQTNNSNSNSDTNDIEDVDSITTIDFEEFSIAINRLIIFDEEKKIKQVQKDTVEIYAELGETIEGQLISISNDQLTNFKIEQRYETSVSIMNDGSHCDLIEWKHFFSSWKNLKANKMGQYLCEKYSKKEYEKFPKISIEDLKLKVKEQCGEEWLKMIGKVKTPNEYPSGVNISRYYLQITGQRKDNGNAVKKLIIIEIPMGC